MHKRDTCDARLLDPGALVESRAFRAPPAAMNAAAAAAMRAGVHGGAALAPKVDDARLHPYVSYRDVGAPQAAPASAATSSTTRRGQRSSLG